MKKTVINLFSGALMLTAMLASCGKDLPTLTLDLQNPSDYQYGFLNEGAYKLTITIK